MAEDYTSYIRCQAHFHHLLLRRVYTAAMIETLTHSPMIADLFHSFTIQEQSDFLQMLKGYGRCDACWHSWTQGRLCSGCKNDIIDRVESVWAEKVDYPRSSTLVDVDPFTYTRE